MKICVFSIDPNMSLITLLQFLMLKVSGMQMCFFIYTCLRMGNHFFLLGWLVGFCFH